MKTIPHIILFCFLLLGCSQPTNEVKPVDHAISSALVSFSISFDQTTPFIPDAPKVGDVCPQCNNPPGKCGVGKVGDGVICDTCLECNGDGVIDEEDINQTFSQKINNECTEDECKCEVCECEDCSFKKVTNNNFSKIIMYSSPGCSVCVKWENEVLPKLKNIGIIVEKRQVNNGRVPRFDIITPTKTVKYTGYISLSAIQEYL